MIRSTSMIPSFIYYVDFSGCTIEEAILSEFINRGTLTLPDINRIRVNGNCLVGSYGSAIRHLRKKGYNIETNVYHDTHKHITRSSYRLLNPTHNPDESELFNNI